MEGCVFLAPTSQIPVFVSPALKKIKHTITTNLS